MSHFHISTSSLTSASSAMERYETQLAQYLQDAARVVTSLSASWTGSASEAASGAMDRWDQSAEQAVESLKWLRQTAEKIHTNYSTAAKQNNEMWG